MEEVPKLAVEYLFTQGILGVMCCILMAACVYLERKRNKDAADNQAELNELIRVHKIEVAQWVKSYNELQEVRVTELKASNGAMSTSQELSLKMLDLLPRRTA